MAGETPGWLEPIWLGDATEAAARVREEDRKDLADALDVGDQKAAAAETLWQGGHGAEGLALARAALTALADGALGPLGRAARARAGVAPDGESGPRSTMEVLAALGEGKAVAARAEKTIREADELTLPERDRDLAPSHADTYRALAEAYRSVARAARRGGRRPRDVAVARWLRIGALALVAATAVAAVVLALHRPPTVTAGASEFFGRDPGFGPDKVLDRDPATNWLLSDDTKGWIEIRLFPPRDIRQVSLLNARNAPYYDRATKRFRLELRRGGEVLASKRGELDGGRRPDWAPLDVRADQVDAIRVYVDTWHEKSGGFAEIRWTEAGEPAPRDPPAPAPREPVPTPPPRPMPSGISPQGKAPAEAPSGDATAAPAGERPIIRRVPPPPSAPPAAPSEDGAGQQADDGDEG